MLEGKWPEKFEEHYHAKKGKWYLQKYKKCKCIKFAKGACIKLRCCEVYKLMPYKVFVKPCKYGPCKWEKKYRKHMHKKKWPKAKMAL